MKIAELLKQAVQRFGERASLRRVDIQRPAVDLVEAFASIDTATARLRVPPPSTPMTNPATITQSHPLG